MVSGKQKPKKKAAHHKKASAVRKTKVQHKKEHKKVHAHAVRRKAPVKRVAKKPVRHPVSRGKAHPIHHLLKSPKVPEHREAPKSVPFFKIKEFTQVPRPEQQEKAAQDKKKQVTLVPDEITKEFQQVQQAQLKGNDKKEGAKKHAVDVQPKTWLLRTQKKAPALSIIIPAFNEEHFIPVLLKSIREQNFADYEIIVADHYSKDRTRRIARDFGCVVIDGADHPGPARNSGAVFAKGDYILFLDADTRLPDGFLERNFAEFKNRKLAVATCRVKPIRKTIFYSFINSVANVWMCMYQFISPHAPGFCIFARRDVHEAIKGFDPYVKLGEDHDYVRRASKLGKFRMLRGPAVEVSMRRYDKEGPLRLVAKYIYLTFYRLFRGEIKKKPVEYNFGKY